MRCANERRPRAMKHFRDNCFHPTIGDDGSVKPIRVQTHPLIILMWQVLKTNLTQYLGRGWMCWSSHYGQLQHVDANGCLHMSISVETDKNAGQTHRQKSKIRLLLVHLDAFPSIFVPYLCPHGDETDTPHVRSVSASGPLVSRQPKSHRSH